MMKLSGIVVLVLLLPIAFLVMILPVNDYRMDGMEGLDIPDCDGPAVIVMFAIPIMLIYGIGAIVFGRLSRGADIAVALLCGLVFLGMIPNLRAAYDEHNRFQQVCAIRSQ